MTISFAPILAARAWEICVMAPGFPSPGEVMEIRGDFLVPVEQDGWV